MLLLLLNLLFLHPVSETLEWVEDRLLVVVALVVAAVVESGQLDPLAPLDQMAITATMDRPEAMDSQERMDLKDLIMAVNNAWNAHQDQQVHQETQVLKGQVVARDSLAVLAKP